MRQLNVFCAALPNVLRLGQPSYSQVTRNLYGR